MEFKALFIYLLSLLFKINDFIIKESLNPTDINCFVGTKIFTIDFALLELRKRKY